MPLGIVRTSGQFPIPQVVSGHLYLENYDFSSGLPDYITAREVNTGEEVWGNDFNRNAAQLDIITQYGAGQIGIVHGLELSAGTGLQAIVGIGGALIGSIIQNPTAQTAVMATSATNYVWFKQDGTLEVKSNTTAPSLAAVCVGIGLTNGSTSTLLDGSGVCYIKNGLSYRESADADYPTDTPPTSWFGLTKTSGGMFLWNGSEHKSIHNDKLTVTAKTASHTVVAADRFKVFTNEGASGEITHTLPAAAAGVGPFSFYVQTAQNNKVVTQTGDTIRKETDVSTASPATVAANQVGNLITIIGINNTEWIVTAQMGPWTLT